MDEPKYIKEDSIHIVEESAHIVEYSVHIADNSAHAKVTFRFHGRKFLLYLTFYQCKKNM